MRFIVLGVGAIGSLIGARLHQSGREVVLVARGPLLSDPKDPATAPRPFWPCHVCLSDHVRGAAFP